MKNISKQTGVGLIEILVALLILAVGVLGFIAMQYRAVEATAEAINRVQAMNVARDLAERIRVNRAELNTYITQAGNAATLSYVTVDCIGVASANKCSSDEVANFDVKQVKQKAAELGMTINMLPCSGNNDGRNCIYVAWGDTSATDNASSEPAGTGDCTYGTSYNPASTCLIMETY
jgi:type IV pilus assembly protein PilV